MQSFICFTFVIIYWKQQASKKTNKKTLTSCLKLFTIALKVTNEALESQMCNQ